MAQCASGVVIGQNLVTNGDFSQDYTGWTHDPAYAQFTPCGSCYSVPGKIYAGVQPSKFNPGGFTDFADHTPTADGKMLMVDGICTAGIPLWSQAGIPLTPNTTYYFEVWITTMSSPTPHGTLQFDIGGTNYATVIQPSNTIGAWTLFSLTYNSGPTPPATTTISIENTETSGCNTAVDFAIDDISFTPGCAFSSVGPTPNLGPDQSICGKGGTITLDANVPHNATTTVTWTNSGGTPLSASGTGLGAPYTQQVHAAGTYTVCVSDNGSCVRSDVITVTASYSINLGPPITLCNPVTATLDAVYTGPGVTYQWYQTAMIPADTIPGAKSRTYTASAAGTYFVKVTDPVCGVQTSSVTITSQAATPNNGVFCGTAKGGTGLTTLSVTGPGKYKWWSASTGGTVLAKGSTYTPPALAGPGPYTYYVEDTSTFTGKIGPPQSGNGFANLAGGGVNASTKANLIFNAIQAFRIDTITVEPYNYYCPSPGAGNVNQINFVVKDSVGNVVGTSSYAAPCINQAQPAAPQKIPVGISVPKGNGYVLTLGAGSSAISLYNNTQNGGSQPSPMLYTYPTTYNVSGNPVATFVSNDAATFNLYNYPDAIPGYFDWKITKGINCQRVPVVATELCTLPLSYVSFDAIPVSGFVKLNWQSSNEVNTNYYTAERSTDGIHFISIGSVDAVGNNSGTISSYSFTDRSPVSGISYYRIREVDQDGSGYYTGVKAVISEENSLVVKPNPNQGSFTASFASGISQRISLNIVNSLGQTVYQFSDVSNSEVFEKNIDLTGLAAGVYVLQVTSGSNSWVKKVMKE